MYRDLILIELEKYPIPRSEFLGFLRHLMKLDFFSSDCSFLFKEYHNYLMSEFDYKMWLYDFANLTHISDHSLIFIYTHQGSEIKAEYFREAMEESLKLFEIRIP